MRIERIKSNNLAGLGDVDWVFPDGPVLILTQDQSQQRIFCSLLLEIFYNIKSAPEIKAQNPRGFMKLWLTGDNSRLRVSRQFYQQDKDAERTPELEIEDEAGQLVLLPASMTLGEYLFRAEVRAFLQGGIVKWPESNERDKLALLVRNMWHGGEAGLSPSKVRASLNGATKRMEEQKESMLPLHSEYAALRSEWEVTHRRQEEERLLLIEMKKLQEREKVLVERISAAEKLLERLTLLTKNPDYRELRKLQLEITRVEEQRSALESSFLELTNESQVDWAVLESLREECLEWACFQAEEGRLAGEIQKQGQIIQETQDHLQKSGFQEVTEDEVLRLRRMEEERLAAQLKLEKLAGVQNKIAKIQKILTEEMSRLEEFADLSGVTDSEEDKIAQREALLAKWRNFRLGAMVDRTIKEQFGGKNIRERLSDRLAHYYQNYRVSDFEEFRLKLRKFRDQQEKVKRLRTLWERLNGKAKREEELRRIVHSRTEILKQALTQVKAADFLAWLNGWEKYRQTKYQLDTLLKEQKITMDLRQRATENVAICAAQLQEKLENRGMRVTDREEALAAILRVAGQLREKDKMERESAELTQRFQNLLGERKMEHLTQMLEPLADLERETRLSNESRLAELEAWQQELVETRQQLKTAGQHLKQRQDMPSLAILENKMEEIKRRWKANEDLYQALADARALWEASWQEWQIHYGQAIEEEAQRILTRISSKNISLNNYFAFRMALTQLSLGENTEVPLILSVGEMREERGFWEEVAAYLRELSLARQVIFITSDTKLWQVFAEIAGWDVLPRSL